MEENKNILVEELKKDEKLEFTDFESSKNITNLLNVNTNYINTKIETALLINELETLKFKNGELNIYTKRYLNIINELFDTVKITDLSQNTKDMVFYVIKQMIGEFNKQYKYKYQWLYAKSILKKLIKIK